MCVIGLCLSRRPSVTLCTDRRTHASRRGLWEGGVALRGCALLLSFPFFPPSRPSSPPVLWPSLPLTYKLQVFYFFFYPATPLPVYFAALQFFSSSSSHRPTYASLQSSFCKCAFRCRVPRCSRRHFGPLDITRETFRELRWT